VSSAEEALTLFRSGTKSYKALVTDVNLKGRQNGWEIARRIREIDPAFPIVYMTGAAADQWPSQGVPNSILLEKPFSPAQLESLPFPSFSTLEAHQPHPLRKGRLSWRPLFIPGQALGCRWSALVRVWMLRSLLPKTRTPGGNRTPMHLRSIAALSSIARRVDATAGFRIELSRSKHLGWARGETSATVGSRKAERRGRSAAPTKWR
jgi:CheY-like chemotaxis protein